MVTSSDGSPITVTNYRWNTGRCFTNNYNTTPGCFPTGQTTPNVTGNNLLAEDAGTITCTVTIDGESFTSKPLTLHISGTVIIEACVIIMTTLACYNVILWLCIDLSYLSDV